MDRKKIDSLPKNLRVPWGKQLEIKDAEKKEILKQAMAKMILRVGDNIEENALEFELSSRLERNDFWPYQFTDQQIQDHISLLGEAQIQHFESVYRSLMK